MFGYVTPCKMELKVKDYEKFKSYYCGLCKEIKNDYGNLPRLTLNYDMTFLAVLLDSLSLSKISYKSGICLIHPVKKKTLVYNNKAIKYAAFCNIILAYFKLNDDRNDDKSFPAFFLVNFFKHLLNKTSSSLNYIKKQIEVYLSDLNVLEKINTKISIDKLSDPFSKLTGFILTSYLDFIDVAAKDRVQSDLYNLGYNLGKWIYIIDAYDDLQDDMRKNKFNPLEKAFNINNLKFKDFRPLIADNVDFLLTSCASSCLAYLDKLPITKNEDLLQNILQLGLIEKMNKVYNKENDKNEKSL
jgi:hypothetical protein